MTLDLKAIQARAEAATPNAYTQDEVDMVGRDYERKRAEVLVEALRDIADENSRMVERLEAEIEILKDRINTMRHKW